MEFFIKSLLPNDANLGAPQKTHIFKKKDAEYFFFVGWGGGPITLEKRPIRAPGTIQKTIFFYMVFLLSEKEKAQG